MFPIVDLDDATAAKASQLRHESLSVEQVSAIMADTFDARRDWIVRKKPTLNVIFTKFPPLRDILSVEVYILLT